VIDTELFVGKMRAQLLLVEDKERFCNDLSKEVGDCDWSRVLSVPGLRNSNETVNKPNSWKVVEHHEMIETHS
jgi:hypothetical protein